MADDLFRRDFRSTRRRPPQQDNLFVWTIAIILLAGLALVCWIGTFYIFGHPELPEPYKILKKLKKIEPPKRFEVTAAPIGDFLTPQKLCDRYSGMPTALLANTNDDLLRDYICNYRRTKRLVPYVTGRYRILSVHTLNSSEMFTSGVVVLAQSLDVPQLLIEHIYPTAPDNIPALKKLLVPGLEIKLQRTYDLAAVIHVARLQNGQLKLTVVPLLYGAYTLRDNSSGFSLQPPADLNVAAGLPILKSTQEQPRQPARAIAANGETAPVENPNVVANATPTPARELVRSETTPTPVPTPAPVTPVVVATPNPVAQSAHHKSAAPTPERTPVEIVRAQPISTPETSPVEISPNHSHVANREPIHETAPRPTPLTTNAETTPHIAPVTPRATPQPVSSHGVALQPFLVSASTPTNNNGGSWPVYQPGQMPRGRLFDVAETADMPNRGGVSGERLYLQGDFIVTASGEHQAVLRPHSNIAARLLAITHSSRQPRIIVEYPDGSTPPPRGAAISRGNQRPFQITSVRKSANGEVNIYVREITAP